MTQIPTGGVGPNKDISVQSAKLEKVRDKTSDKVSLSSKGTSEVSRPSRVAKAKKAISNGLNALKTFLGKKSTSGAVDNTNIAKTTASALNSGRDQLTSQPNPPAQATRPLPPAPSRPVARPLPTPGQRSNSDAMSPKELNPVRPGSRPLPTPGQRSNSDAVSEKKLNVRPGPKLTPKVIEKKEYDISARMFKKELEAEKQAAMNDQDFPSDLPPESSDDLLPENLPPSDLPQEWSDALLPKEGEVGWKEPTESLGVTGEKAVEQSAKNELICGHIFNEIVTTEATYLSGLRDFNAILDDAVKQNPTNQQLISLSQDHKAHLAKAEAFSSELNRVKDETGLDMSKKVIQLYDEKLIQGYAKSISSLACNYGTNLKVVDSLKKDLQSIYPDLNQVELNKKTATLSDRGIILPIQRMPRHVMLLTGIKNNAPQNETELKNILDKALDLTTQINEDKRKSEVEESKLKSVTENKKKSSFFRK